MVTRASTPPRPAAAFVAAPSVGAGSPNHQPTPSLRDAGHSNSNARWSRRRVPRRRLQSKPGPAGWAGGFPQSRQRPSPVQQLGPHRSTNGCRGISAPTVVASPVARQLSSPRRPGAGKDARTTVTPARRPRAQTTVSRSMRGTRTSHPQDGTCSMARCGRDVRPPPSAATSQNERAVATLGRQLRSSSQAVSRHTQHTLPVAPGG